MCGIVFVTGGVRSGKSNFAERYIQTRTNCAAYVATSVAFDEEMAQRIKKHQHDRLAQPFQWHVVEMPYELQRVTSTYVLFECATTWLTNYFMLKQQKDAVAYFQNWLLEVSQQATIVVVSNELLDSGLTSFTETNAYLQQIGQLHQWLVEQSKEVYECTNTFVKRWK